MPQNIPRGPAYRKTDGNKGGRPLLSDAAQTKRYEVYVTDTVSEALMVDAAQRGCSHSSWVRDAIVERLERIGERN